MFRLFSVLSRHAFIALPLLITMSPTGALSAADVAKVGAKIDRPVKAINLSKNAPEIVLLAPKEGGTYVSPIGIKIAFEPEQGATVDLDSLKVTVVSKTAIGVFELDITEDIASYASKDGINAPSAEIPAGEHVVTIQVADSENRMAVKELAITVREESVLERRARE